MTDACCHSQCVFSPTGAEVYCPETCIFSTRARVRAPTRRRSGVEQRSYDAAAQILERGIFPDMKVVAENAGVSRDDKNAKLGRRRALLEFGYVLRGRRYVKP